MKKPGFAYDWTLCRNWNDLDDIVEPEGVETKTSAFPEEPGGVRKGDALERKRIAGIEAERSSDIRYILHFLDGRIFAADFYGDLCWIAAEAVPVDLHQVAARIRAGVWEELQNLRTVAEGVRGDGKPAVLEIRAQIDGAVRDAWRRVRLDLGESRNGDVLR